MFNTIEERQAFIDSNNLRMINGDIVDAIGSIYNPWCFEYEAKDGWKSLVGIAVTHNDALQHLYELKSGHPETRFRMYRANDLELLTIYTT